MLFNERGQTIKLARDNNLLKILNDNERRKIQELLYMTKPHAGEVTAFKDSRPKRGGERSDKLE